VSAKHRVWVVILALTVFISVGGLFYITPKKMLRISPIVLPDGRVEYRLVNAGMDKVRGNKDDEVWVLSFSRDINIIWYDAGRGEMRARENPNYKYNWDMGMSVSWADILGRGDGAATVYVTAERMDYGTGKFVPYDGTYSSEIWFRRMLECRPDFEISPGIFRVRQLRSSEVGEVEEALKREYVNVARPSFGGLKCGSGFSQNNDLYVVFDAKGGVIGEGQCAREPYDLTAGSSPDKGWCRFNFWLPPGRVVSYGFSRVYLRDARALHEYVSGLFTAATDVYGSRNIAFDGE